MRRAGLLLHPSSLPGPYGIGDIGPSARSLMAWCASAGMSIWQFLPLNPVDGLGCPYASPSAFAAEPLLLSPDDLVRDGWLMRTERPLWAGGIDAVDWPRLRRVKEPMLRRAARRVARTVDLNAWAVEREWARSWATYAARARRDGHDWPAWSKRAAAVDPMWVEEELALQWLFERQWSELREVAKQYGIALWGDLPMFVGAQSADTWAHPELFQLGRDQRPSVVTGAPPDAFTPDGQKWGHAHFAVDAHRKTNHAWWLARVHRLLEHVDAVRLDHFRGLSQVWEIPAGDPDARIGKWVDGLGAPLLAAIQQTFGHVPIVAEDLGVITPDVAELRDDFALPGMAILQFAFSGERDATQPYLPHNHRHNLVVYPGTHDNNTVRGWYASVDEGTRDHVRRYLSVSGEDIAGDFVRTAYRSVADTCIVALQDVLSLDARSRMNTPGTADGNWSWRVRAQALNVQVASRMRDEAELAGRTRVGLRGVCPDAASATLPPSEVRVRFVLLLSLSGCCLPDGLLGGESSDEALEVGETREVVTRSRSITELINPGSQQGRPDPPREVITRSQCGDTTDGGPVDDQGITGRIECGEQLVGHTRGGVRAFDTRFYEAHFCTPATTDHSGGDERIYRLSVPEGRLRPWVTLDTPCADLDLAVIKWSGRSLPTEGSSVADCEMFPKDGRTREIVDVTSDRATEWLIVVEGKGDEEGAFGLTVQCMPW